MRWHSFVDRLLNMPGVHKIPHLHACVGLCGPSMAQGNPAAVYNAMSMPLGVDHALAPPIGRQARLVDPHQDCTLPELGNHP